MALRCLQANINHSARAQDLLVQNFPTIEGVVKGKGCVLAFVGGVAIIGVYASPNRTLAEFERLLVEVGALVGQASPTPVLVAGNFNAKSTAWGSPVTDVRGEALKEWAVSLGLTPMNSGSESTCVRQQGELIVDVTFASIALARRVREWRVETEVETLSDHRYIRFDVSVVPVSAHATVGQSSGPRWKLSRLDSQLAKEATIVESWGTAPDSVVQVDREADRLGCAPSRVCDAAMPRAKPLPPRRRVYAASTHGAVGEESKVISHAMEEAWREWLATLDADPWGRPYRMERQKLRPWAPPLTSTLQPDVLESVVGALFPERGEFIPPSMAPLNDHDRPDQASPVTEVELCAAVVKLGSKRQPRGPTEFQDVP
ncbi:uncharacterized protein LOC124542591 [Vanessa cardui]|uniref:uncharacterized protein LOC124542591 n=1 Tax=Vanessa cardui TaxID=171605 RepID=UPI001F13A386|nr:uncharacterized protein LOC124542591 [Vanessa cardui]